MTVATEPQQDVPPSPSHPAAPRASASLRALLRRGLLDRRRAPLTWGGSLGALSALVALLYPSIEDSIGAAVEGYPQGVKEAFGIEELTSFEAYLHAEMFSLVVPLAVAFFAVRSSARAISVAEERGYLDTLLTTPLSRRLLVAGSFAVTAVAVAGILVVIGVLTGVATALGGTEVSVGLLAAGTANVWPLAVFFAGVAVLAAGLAHRSTTVTGIATGVLVTMYVVDLLGKVSDGFEPLRWASAFKYYGVALRDGIDPLAFAGLALAGVVLAALGALCFERRDVLR